MSSTRWCIELCPKRSDRGDPHARVARSKPFEVGWMTGERDGPTARTIDRVSVFARSAGAAGKFWSTGFAVVDRFIPQETCEDLLRAATAYKTVHDLPLVARNLRSRSLRYYVIDGDHVEEALGHVGLADLLACVDRLVGEMCGSDLRRMEGQVGVNVNITPPGGSYRWHYDRNVVTALLYLNSAVGGEIEFLPNYRLAVGRFQHGSPQRWADALLGTKVAKSLVAPRRHSVAPAPGRLLVIRGDRCLHSVKPVRDVPDRVNLVVAYASPAAGCELPGLDSYLYSTAPSMGSDPNYRRARVSLRSSFLSSAAAWGSLSRLSRPR
jgi:hypothetical protein